MLKDKRVRKIAWLTKSVKADLVTNHCYSEVGAEHMVDEYLATNPINKWGTIPITQELVATILKASGR